MKTPPIVSPQSVLLPEPEGPMIAGEAVRREVDRHAGQRVNRGFALAVCLGRFDGLRGCSVGAGCAQEAGD